MFCCQDASLLLDLCRQCIMFEDVADIAACLRVISADLDVHIVRIKNRLDPRYNAAITAGYRDVVLNLRIANELTAANIQSNPCSTALLILANHCDGILWQNLCSV